MKAENSVLLCTARESGVCRFVRQCEGECQAQERIDQTGDYSDLMVEPTHYFSSADTVAHYINGEWIDVPLAKTGVVHFMGYLPLWMGGPYLTACAADPSNMAIGEGELYDWDKVTCEDCKTINNPWPQSREL